MVFRSRGETKIDLTQVILTCKAENIQNGLFTGAASKEFSRGIISARPSRTRERDIGLRTREFPLMRFTPLFMNG